MSESSLKKILIVPYFGDLPEWIDKFEPPKGYHMILDRDIEKFKQRVGDKLGLEYPGKVGSGKVWDYRCALGILYSEEISGFDYWGHCDLDVVWGDMEFALPDDVLSQVDVYSSHNEYVCGCFSLYKNIPEVNNLFKNYPFWGDKMVDPDPIGWVEQEFSRTLEKSGLRYAYTFNQGNPWDKNPVLKKEGEQLFQFMDGAWKEIMFFHFRHSKQWPL
jgi:hypothetical protein